MLHNFTKQVANAKYIAVSGDNANSGTDPNEPKATIQALGDQVVGPGVYRGNTAAPNAFTQNIEADTIGTVKWITQQANGSRHGGYTGIHFIGDPFFKLGQLEVSFCDDCVIENCDDYRGNPVLNRSVVLNSNVVAGDGFRPDGSIIVSSDMAIDTMVNSYVDPSSLILIVRNTAPTLFKYNNIQGTISIGGQLYVIQDQLTGTPQDNGYAAGVDWLNESNLTANGYTGEIGGWDDAVATCMNKDPRFTDATRGVYKLQGDSPMIGAAENGLDNIGGKPFGFFVTPDGANNETVFVIVSPEMDMTNPSEPKLKAGEVEGTIRYVVKVSDEPVNFDSPIDFEGILAFDTDFPGGTAQNNNVPSYEPIGAITDLTTTASSPDTSTLISAGHGLSVGMAVRVAGQTRLISAVTTDNITVDTPLRSVIGQLEPFIAGAERDVRGLNPNKFDLRIRTSKSGPFPANDLDWDNDLDPALGYSGEYLTQEFYRIPEKIFDGNLVYGNADPQRPLGVPSETFELTWFDAIITFRNNYRG